ncbi:hypothetical protein Ahy_A08g038495 [Arachis hypogaea]|uniref:Uncharacterized protein n=1 Tax=Arachis hypogaea TaxID=3818 RepID=A0A445BTL7_ARAHY|nr:hypothetical protein Ahy_A08g038495 [Arachis hypogaea]
MVGMGKQRAAKPITAEKRQPWCKYFLWLDEHITGLGVGITRHLGHEQILHGDEHYWNKDMEKRIRLLEKRIEGLEVKKNPIGWSICVMFVLLIFALFMPEVSQSGVWTENTATYCNLGSKAFSLLLTICGLDRSKN